MIDAFGKSRPFAFAALDEAGVAMPWRAPGSDTLIAMEPTGLLLDVATSMADLDALRDDWNGLFARAGQAHQVFQTFGFASLWARHFLTPQRAGAAGDRCGSGCGLAIVTARRSGRLVLVWPLAVLPEMGMRVLTGLGEPVAQYCDAVLDPAEAATGLLRSALDYARKATAADLIRLRKVRADAAIAPLLAEIGTYAADPVKAPFVTLRAGGSCCEDRQSGKARKNRRRLMRRLEEQGRVEFVISAGGDAAAGLIAAGLAAKRDWLQRRGLLSPAIADCRLDGFLSAAATTHADTTGCRLFGLQLDGRTIALAMGFGCKGKLMLHLITQTADVERFGTGVLNLEAILRQVEGEGLEALDLLPPKADYKEDWADGAVGVADHVLGLSPAGRIWALAYDRIVKPHLKRTVQVLPLSVRQRLSARSLARG